MKKLKQISLFIMVVSMLIMSVGCSKGQDVAKGKPDVNGKPSVNKNVPLKLQNPNISVMTIETEISENLAEASKSFETKYGGKVEFIHITFEDLQSKLVARVSSGSAPDVVWLNNTTIPLYPVKNLLQPVDPYIDISDPIWDVITMDQLKWGGKYYGITQFIRTHKIFFNKTMFENNGLQTPLELYQAGNWNWNTFAEAGKALTQDLNHDGVIDQWGFMGLLQPFFAIANGGQ